MSVEGWKLRRLDEIGEICSGSTLTDGHKWVKSGQDKGCQKEKSLGR